MSNEVHRILKEARAVRIEVGEDEVLFIGIDAGKMPPNKALQYQDTVLEKFRKVLPEDVKIITGPKNMDFVVIGKKTAFNEKLKGTVK